MNRISVENLSKKFASGSHRKQGLLFHLDYFLKHGKFFSKPFTALSDVSFDVSSGEILGLIGPNGAGKSTLLRVIGGIYPKFKGKVEVNGKVASLMGAALGLDSRLSAKENIFFLGSLFGMKKHEIEKKFDQIISFSGMQDYADTIVYKFSTGMVQKIIFSVAIASEPDILLLDEVFEVGDESFRQKSMKVMQEITKKGGCIILAGHFLPFIEENCSKVILLENGSISKHGKTKEEIREVIESYQKK